MAGRIGEFQPAGAAGKEHDILGVGGGRDIDDAVADLGDAAAGDDGAAEDVNEAVGAAGEQRAGIGHRAAEQRPRRR